MNTSPTRSSKNDLVTLSTSRWRRLPESGLPEDREDLESVGALRFRFVRKALRKMRRHASSLLSDEVGGILLGKVYRHRGVYRVVVEETLAARLTVSSPVHLTFTAATWIDLIIRRARHPGAVTVGWYHTHPSMGIFLSGSDLFLHRSFFGHEPWYLAAVIDPVSEEEGIFAWDGQGMVRCLDDRKGAITPGRLESR